jgi:CheY-like chemotaxis protein
LNRDLAEVKFFSAALDCAHHDSAAHIRRAGTSRLPVREARNGCEALERFDQSIDLLLADIRLPLMSGTEVLVRLRQQRPILKVLAISGFLLNAHPMCRSSRGRSRAKRC